MTLSTSIRTFSTNQEPATLKLTGEIEKLSIDEQVRKIVTSDQFNVNAADSRGYEIGKTGPDPEGLKILPEAAKKRFEEFGVDVSAGYPERPKIDEIPVFWDEAYAIRNEDYPYVERGKNADPEKKALFGAAKEVRNLTNNIGTEIIGLQLSDLTDQQKDELALLIVERVLSFFMIKNYLLKNKLN